MIFNINWGVGVRDFLVLTCGSLTNDESKMLMESCLYCFCLKKIRKK